MKIKISFLLILFVTSFTACKKDSIEHKSDFEKSMTAWTNFKAQSQNNYRYTVTSSSWTGYSTETTITVLNGTVAIRTFVAKGKHPQTNNLEILEEWQEDKLTFNTHTNAAALITLDDIYAMAKNELLLKRKGAETYFEAKNNGLISSAGYVEENCADDCFRGINISNITNLLPSLNQEIKK